MIVKILIALLILIIGIGFGTMVLCVLGWDETSKRERWSRTLDEEDYFKVDLPEFLKKDETTTGNEEFSKHIMDRFTKVR